MAMGESPELAAHESAPDVADRDAELHAMSYEDARRTVLEDFERRHVTQLLRATGDNVAAA